MRKWAISIAVFGIITAACGSGQVTGNTSATGATAAPPNSTEATTTTTAPSTTSGDNPDPTTAASTTTPVVVDGPPAPDFTLALESPAGGSFTLSEEQKPVYIVFWAEW